MPDRIPTSGWMPGVPLKAGPTADAHYVPEDAERVRGRYGSEFRAVCGARCYPIYGNDPSRIAAHPTCPACDQHRQATA